MKAKTFDRKFHAGEQILDQLDLGKARRAGTDAKRVNVDFPAWMVGSLDREARRLGVTRQSRACRIRRGASLPDRDGCQWTRLSTQWRCAHGDRRSADPLRGVRCQDGFCMAINSSNTRRTRISDMSSEQYASYKPVSPYFDLVRGALGVLVDGEHFFDCVSDDIV
jgi:hypothetical protein